MTVTLRTSGSRRTQLRRQEAWLLAGIIVLGALLRFPTLGVQSYWYDEAVTVVRVLHPSLTDTLSAVASSESTPPLYYVLAWVWSKLFGTGEVGLRALSAVIGTATIPVVYAAATEAISRRAGLIAAALAAVSPWLVWYSQEARSYALLMLLGGLSFLFFVRSLRQPRPRVLASWALASCLAVATHYFAALIVIPETVWLWMCVRRRELRAVALATSAIAAAGAALAPLAIHQASHGLTDWIGGFTLRWRLEEVPKQFIAGDRGVPWSFLWLLLAVLLANAIWLLLARTSPEERGRALVPAALGAGVVGVPLALALVGKDYLFARNLAVAWIPLATTVAAGLGAQRAGRAGIALALVLVGLLGCLVVADAISPRLQRTDWREGAELVGAARADRAIVLPFTGGEPLRFYLDGTNRLDDAGAVREITLLGWTRPEPGFRPPGGFKVLNQTRRGIWVVVRLGAPRRTRVTRDTLTSLRLDPGRAGVLMQAPTRSAGCSTGCRNRGKLGATRRTAARLAELGVTWQHGRASAHNPSVGGSTPPRPMAILSFSRSRTPHRSRR
jgi:mannosyltransferase